MSIEYIPRWWPGLSSGRWGSRAAWVRINDDDPIPMNEIPNYKLTKYEYLYLFRGDFIQFSDGECWGCMDDGDCNTARMVRAINCSAA